MFKFRYLLFILATAFFWSANAEAKVCFLVNADGSENCSEAGFVGETSCIGMGCQQCTFPKADAGVTPCDCSMPNYYKPEDCCSNPRSGGGGVDCPEPKQCQTIKGVPVDGCPTGDTIICPTDAVCRCPFTYISRADYNRLPASKRRGLTACDSPKVLGGEQCDDGDGIKKYEKCDCPEEYKACPSPAVGVGQSCDNKYKSCTCPSDFKSTKPKCFTSCQECTLDNVTLYKCNTVDIPTCRCSVKYDNGCPVGCSDRIPDDYDYIGKILSNVSFKIQNNTLQNDGICATGPCCTPGNWDKTEWCDANTCTALGYTETSCGSRPFVGCPCDITKKKCLGGGGSSSTCPTGTMTKAECMIENAVFTDTSTNGSGCGTCACPTGQVASSDGKRCIPSCQKGCPDDATYITSADQISKDTTKTKYCLGKSITLTNDVALLNGTTYRSFEFYSGCNVTLTVKALASKIVSYVNTVITDGAGVHNLELHAGGTFEKTMAPDTSTGTTKPCQVKVYGGYTYKFTNVLKELKNNTPVVSCMGTPTLGFAKGSTTDSLYTFNNCYAKCYLNNSPKDCGWISTPDTSGNYCKKGGC